MESGNQTNGITLLPCPFCGGEAITMQDDDGKYHTMTRCYEGANSSHHAFVIADTEAEAIEAWNTRACPEEGAIIATEENMAAYGWVRERTCRPSGEWESISQTQEVRHVSCSECGHEFGMDEKDTIPFKRTRLVELPNFCPNCGRRVVDDRQGD